MQHPSMPVAAFLASVLILLPFAVQRALFRRQNIPSFAIASWLLFANIICGVDTLVWARDAAVRIPIWCDITTKYLIGVSYAVPACLFIMSTRLRLAAARNTTRVDRSVRELRDAFLVDLAMCAGMPLVAMIIHTVVQGHRFDIFQSIGCQPNIPAVSAGTIFFWLPAIILAILALLLCGSSWRTILGPERTWLGVYLDNFDPTLSTHLFFSQLMLILCLASLWTAFLVMTIYESLALGGQGLNALPINWSRIDSYSLADFSENSWRNRMFCWWAIPVAGFAFSFWFTIFPVAEKIEGVFHRVHARFAGRKVAKDSIIALKDLKIRESSSGRVVVRKCSTVEITVEDYAPYPRNPDTRQYATSPTKEGYEPRWSCPWEGAHPLDTLKERSFNPALRSSQDGSHEFVIKELPIDRARIEDAKTSLRESKFASTSPL